VLDAVLELAGVEALEVTRAGLREGVFFASRLHAVEQRRRGGREAELIAQPLDRPLELPVVAADRLDVEPSGQRHLGPAGDHH
jgi:exopolyphosphatase/pppGpp-phosphohydrolase